MQAPKIQSKCFLVLPANRKCKYLTLRGVIGLRDYLQEKPTRELRGTIKRAAKAAQ